MIKTIIHSLFIYKTTEQPNYQFQNKDEKQTNINNMAIYFHSGNKIIPFIEIKFNH